MPTPTNRSHKSTVNAPQSPASVERAPDQQTTEGSRSGQSNPSNQPVRSRDIQFLIVAGSTFFVVMVTQYVLLVLDKPEPIPWQKGTVARAFRVDVNKAEWAEWTQLQDLGMKMAMRIVADRDANGPFQSIDDLLRVEGIGRTTLDRIRPSLTISHH